VIRAAEDDTMSRFQTVVAALDFSDSASDALDAALALVAAEPSGRIHLLHVVPSAVPDLWSEDLPPVDLRAVEQGRTDHASTQLAALALSRALDPSGATAAVVVGAAALEIVRYAEAHRADVIVLGSHGHGLVRRFLLGSVADKVVRQAHCAVLIVPHRTLRGPASPVPEPGPAIHL
jgi:nucleotide-binding universal stress UspA family protein